MGERRGCDPIDVLDRDVYSSREERQDLGAEDEGLAAPGAGAVGDVAGDRLGGLAVAARMREAHEVGRVALDVGRDEHAPYELPQLFDPRRRRVAGEHGLHGR